MRLDIAHISPLKLFVFASALLFVLGCVNYAWNFTHDGRLTDGSTLMWSAAVIVFGARR